MQYQEVPVVVYENDKRHEVGTAHVRIDGKNMAVIAKTLPIFDGWDLPQNLEISFQEVKVEEPPLDPKIIYGDGSDNA